MASWVKLDQLVALARFMATEIHAESIFGGVPETGRHIQDFTGLQSKAGLCGFGEQGKFFDVRALDVADDGNVIAFLYIEIRGLIRWVGVELFGSVQLANESLSVGTVEMHVGKLAAASTDEKTAHDGERERRLKPYDDWTANGGNNFCD